jgi:hypothetical protein
MDYVFKFSPKDEDNPKRILQLRATPTTGGGRTKCRSFESENDLLRFLLNFPRLRLDRRSPVFLSDQRAAELGFVDC